MQDDSLVGVYSIDAASEATGIPPTTLRYWEKAYGIVVPERTSGGHRLYSQDDIERLTWVKRKIAEEGLKASSAFALLERQLGRIDVVSRTAAAKGAIMILVAEKDPITAGLEEYFLNREGYEVLIVLDGRVAAQIAKKKQPDLIILDVILPGLSGLKVCKALKEDPKTARIPTLVFSVLDVRDQALDAGADAFLLKPIEQPRLIEAVKELLPD